ncbi:uncharacterized protein KY384_001659 [Bacidia gigantensis]|uniref:uncharacterized protein n=1 Tax=Bacidia gigantensis TaxID=2732470 RepID=UPI001D04E969|nr:uncharacterized protein KY384_001659 [Bacidia gigantensis]KAG8533918.1 hypothetical protein KY384_001659 [Bacidia gigantensis]
MASPRALQYFIGTPKSLRSWQIEDLNDAFFRNTTSARMGSTNPEDLEDQIKMLSICEGFYRNTHEIILEDLLMPLMDVEIDAKEACATQLAAINPLASHFDSLPVPLDRTSVLRLLRQNGTNSLEKSKELLKANALWRLCNVNNQLRQKLQSLLLYAIECLDRASQETPDTDSAYGEAGFRNIGYERLTSLEFQRQFYFRAMINLHILTMIKCWLHGFGLLARASVDHWLEIKNDVEREVPGLANMSQVERDEWIERLLQHMAPLLPDEGPRVLDPFVAPGAPHTGEALPATREYDTGTRVVPPALPEFRGLTLEK